MCKQMRCNVSLTILIFVYLHKMNKYKGTYLCLILIFKIPIVKSLLKNSLVTCLIFHYAAI